MKSLPTIREMRKRTEAAFVVLPRRWVVERTFGWMTRHRRLVRDYESRLTETSLWDRAYLDLVEPAFVAFAPAGDGEFRFGVVVASLDCAYSQTDVGFEWQGSDEQTEVQGNGWAEPDGPDTIKGEIAFHNGDETTFKARRAYEAFFSSLLLS